MTPALAVGARATDLVPGSPDRLDVLAARCRTMSEGLGGAAARLRAVDAGEWVGPAGDAFRAVVDAEPDRFDDAARAFALTGTAVRSYAVVLREAQEGARRAIGLHEEAVRRSAAWQATERRSTYDPGSDQRHRAAVLLDDARHCVQDAGDRAARAIAAGWADAPREPRWWESAGHFVAEVGRGALEATTGLVDFAWTVSPVRMMVDPEGWAGDMTALGNGLAFGVTHPVELGKALVDWDTWQESPGRAIGHLVPDLLLALGTGGSGAVAARGARAAETMGDLGDLATTFGRLDRAGESGQRLSYLQRAQARLAGQRELPEPNLPASPAGAAAAFQGTPPYSGVDRWWNTQLRAGDEIASGSLAGRDLRFSGFSVPRSVADDVGTDAARLYEGVQVQPWRGTYRDELTVLRATRDVDVGVGYALADQQFGPGGLRQVFVPDLDRLVRDGAFDVAERRAMDNTTARIGAEVAAR
ncbi:MAG: putative T7SS-secreted protein [Actinomycetes bacterium]